jgi:hypothetical protein
MDLMNHPDHETLRDWIQDTVMRVIAASDRNDNFVLPWIMRTRYIEVTMAELGIVPHHFTRLDRLLVQALKNVLDRRSDLYRGIVHEDLGSLEKHQTQLSGLQIMRKLFMTFATTHSLCQYASHMDISRSKWLGDGMMRCMYMRMMEDLWEDLGNYTEVQKRDIVAGHMESSNDPYLKSDLAEYKRHGSTIPLGPNHTHQFLWDAIKRRIAEFTKKQALSNRDKARQKEMNQIKAEAARYNASHDADGNALSAAGGGPKAKAKGKNKDKDKKKDKDKDKKDKKEPKAPDKSKLEKKVENQRDQAA